jgi:hypothetical protein
VRAVRRQIGAFALGSAVASPLWLLAGPPYLPAIWLLGVAWGFGVSWYNLRVFDQNYRKELLKATSRYTAMAIDHGDELLADWAEDIEEGVREGLPLIKMSRWLGNLQGKLHERGYTTDDIERDVTRSWFRHLDFGNKWGLWN